MSLSAPAHSYGSKPSRFSRLNGSIIMYGTFFCTMFFARSLLSSAAARRIREVYRIKRQEVLAHWHLESRSEKFPCCLFNCQGAADKKLPFQFYNRKKRPFFHMKTLIFEDFSKIHYYCTISAIPVSPICRVFHAAFSGFFHAPAKAFCNPRSVPAQYRRASLRRSKYGRLNQIPRRSIC